MDRQAWEALMADDKLYKQIAELMKRNMELVREAARYRNLCDEMAELIKIGQSECALRAYRADDIVGRWHELKARNDGDAPS